MACAISFSALPARAGSIWLRSTSSAAATTAWRITTPSAPPTACRRSRSFSQITSDPALAASLQSLYGSVDNIDLWVGGLAENHVAGSSIGTTFQRILADQFQRLRDGDRFWYQREFSGRQLDQINNTTLADIIARNTTTTNMQANVFFFNAKVTGTVFDDRNNNGRQDRLEQGLGGQTVQLLDSEGNLLATTLTRSSGDYQFEQLDLRQYQIDVVPAGAWSLINIGGASVQVTRGGTVSNIDIGLQQTRSTPPRVQPNPFAPRPITHKRNRDLFE